MSARRPWLERLGLHRPELRAWAMYDWANSAFFLVIIAGIFPIYYQRVAAGDLPGETATGRYGWATTGALALVAVLSPVLGALADYLAIRKRLLALFLGIGASAAACMFFIRQGDWALALVLFAIGNLGVAGSFVFYDSLLPHIASGEELDRVSTGGYALGYFGSSLLLILNLAWIQKPHWFGFPDAGVATRASLASVALWWVVFAIPLFRKIPEPPRVLEADEASAASAVRVTFRRLLETFGELRGSYRQAFLLLLAFLIYNDGILTIIRMATLYASGLGLDQNALILAILMVQFVGIPFAFLFGNLAARIGTKRAIYLALAVYVGISVLGYRLDSEAEFFLLAFLVGTVQGGAQALSRSLFASMIPKHKAAEFFGFFSVFEKFAGIFGPALFSVMIALTGSAREAILTVVAFFVVGGLLLTRVDVDEGRRQAREAGELLVKKPAKVV